MPLTVYKCSLCGKEFSSWNDCFEHENDHIKPLRIKEYGEYYEQYDYPCTLVVEMSDGTLVNYRIQYIAGTEQAFEKETKNDLDVYTVSLQKFYIDNK